MQQYIKTMFSFIFIDYIVFLLTAAPADWSAIIYATQGALVAMNVTLSASIISSFLIVAISGAGIVTGIITYLLNKDLFVYLLYRIGVAPMQKA